MVEETTAAVFHPEAYLLTEYDTENSLEHLENDAVYSNNDGGFVVDYQTALDALGVEEDEVLEEVREERPHAFAYLDGDIGDAVDEEFGGMDAIVKSTVGTRMVENNEYDWQKSSLDGSKVVVGEDPEKVWRQYRASTFHEREPSLDLELPKNQVGISNSRAD